MQKRYVSIWFRYLKTDWFTRRNPAIINMPFVLATPSHGKMMITAANEIAEKDGVTTGMAVADARALVSGLKVLDDRPGLSEKLLHGLAEWFIRFTSVVSIDLPDGIILDASGCAHLWGGEAKYITDIRKRMEYFGYAIRIAMADTIGAAWAVARFGNDTDIIEPGHQGNVLLSLPAASLRLENETTDRLNKLGLSQVSSFINMQRPALRRRFGQPLLHRIDQALGHTEEAIIPVHSQEPFKEWLPCMEPIVTATGIEIALNTLLENICSRLKKEEKGLRCCSFQCYRVDGKIEKLSVATNHPSSNKKHLFKLFENRIDTIEPALGIELFTLEAAIVEEAIIQQEALWKDKFTLDNIELAELLDRIECKIGEGRIHRFIPDEHYWPERSFKSATLTEKPGAWSLKQRPLQVLAKPAVIEVTAPIPDYPPMMFRYKGKLHKVAKADGPERIEQEWWLQDGQHRDYYVVEDEEGNRYWLFRSGHYNAERTYQWFLHGYFP